MLNRTHVMMDFETLGLSANAPIVQIGACYFNPRTGEVTETFERNLNLTDVVREGFHVEPETLLWWLNQSDEARSKVLTQDKHFTNSARGAVYALTDFMGPAEVVWSHLTLDAMLLAEYQRRLKIVPLTPHYAHRDLRTLVDLAGIRTSDFLPVGEAHVALDDCKFQVQYCVEALRRIYN